LVNIQKGKTRFYNSESERRVKTDTLFAQNISFILKLKEEKVCNYEYYFNQY